MTEPTLPLGTRVRVIGGPLWSAWGRGNVGSTGTIADEPAWLADFNRRFGKERRPGLMWFEIDPDQQSAIRTSQYVIAEEVEIIEPAENVQPPAALSPAARPVQLSLF